MTTPMLRLLKRIKRALAIIVTVGACLLLTPALVTSAGCCPGPNCAGPGSGSGTGSGEGEGGCGNVGQVCCAGVCSKAPSLVCSNPDAGALSRCNHCGGLGEPCCDGMSCPDPAAPYCNDKYSGGVFTCQNLQ